MDYYCTQNCTQIKAITFILRDKTADSTPVEVLYSCHDGRLKYYTREHVDPNTWPNVHKATRSILNRIEAAITSLATDYKFKGAPLTKEVLRTHLDKLLHKKKADAAGYFDKLQDALDKMGTGEILTAGKKRYTQGYLKTAGLTLRNLQKFDSNMSVVTLDTYHRFISWCQKKNFSINYIGAQVKNWKILGKAATNDPIYSDPEFKKVSEETTDIYLTEQEIERMMKADVPNTCVLARDWFIIQCCTGLRVSDLVRLSNDNLFQGTISIITQKTGEKVAIPVHRFVKAILKKYKGFPPPVTDVEINREIKKVAKKAKITGKVLYSINKGGRRVDEQFEKWELTSSHTARRSFVTNARKNGVPDSIVMKLAGIRSPGTMKRYDRLTSDEAARIAAGLDFFK